MNDQPQSPGERIINEIVKQGMVQLGHPPIPRDETVVFVWAANSADQLSAAVAEECRKIAAERDEALKRLDGLLRVAVPLSHLWHAHLHKDGTQPGSITMEAAEMLSRLSGEIRELEGIK